MEFKLIHVTHLIGGKRVTCEDASVQVNSGPDFWAEALAFWLGVCTKKCPHKGHKAVLR